MSAGIVESEEVVDTLHTLMNNSMEATFASRTEPQAPEIVPAVPEIVSEAPVIVPEA